MQAENKENFKIICVCRHKFLTSRMAMAQTVECVTHGEHLLEQIAKLLPTESGTPSYSDVKINVGGQIFHCHKLVLMLQSPYFEEKLSNMTECVTEYIDLSECSGLNHVAAEDFASVLRFLYVGEIDLNENNVMNVLEAAFCLMIAELKKICEDYMVSELCADNCCQFWKLAEIVNSTELASACKQFSLKEFPKISVANVLCNLPEKLFKELLASDELNTGSEVDICESLLKWLEGMQEAWDNPDKLCTFLTLIRWSAVPIEYVKSKFLKNRAFMEDSKCFKFLSQVITYHLTGVQFDGLRTFPRPSTGVEKCVVIVGLDTGDSVSSDVYRLNLQQKECRLQELPSLQTPMQFEATACVRCGNSLYLTGVGTSSKEVWKWDATFGWGRCADMISARRRHCSTFATETSLFVLGGFKFGEIIGDVEIYSVLTNRWKQVGALKQPVESAGCVLSRTSIYIFGGVGTVTNSDIYSDVDCIQVFDTATKECIILEKRLPQPERLLQAVMWERSVILISYRTCLVFDTDQKTFQSRNHFAAIKDHFGLVLEDQRIFIFGGQWPIIGKHHGVKYMCSNKVKSIPVMDIISNRTEAKWDFHTRLPIACCINAFGIVTLPVCSDCAKDAEVMNYNTE